MNFLRSHQLAKLALMALKSWQATPEYSIGCAFHHSRKDRPFKIDTETVLTKLDVQ